MELFNYLLKASACSVLFFAFYLLVLRKLTFFKLNRFYLLITLLLSFLIPALSITIEKQVAQALPIAEETATVDLPSQVETVMPTEVFPLQTSQVTPSFDWFSLLPYSYAAVAFTLLLIGLWQLSSLLWHTRSNQKTANGLKLVNKKSGFTNCSFFNYVFVDQEKLTEQELAVLLKHEQVHAQQYHSADKIIMMVTKAVMWFNPVIYFWDKTLEQVHEYEADEATSAHFGSKEYASLLLRLAVSKSNTPLIHNFVKSPIKERIKMLFNSKSKNMKKLTYMLVVPIVLGLIWGFTVEVVEIEVKHKKTNELNRLTEKTGKELWGKTIKGKVKTIVLTEVGEILNFGYDKGLVRVFNPIKGKIKVGDELTMKIGGTVHNIAVSDAKGNVINELDAPCITADIIKSSTGKILYELKNEQKPFISKTSVLKGNDYREERITLNTYSGKILFTKMVFLGQTDKSAKIYISVNGKLYNEQESLKFDKNFISKLSTNRGFSFANDFDIPEIKDKNGAVVFWFGQEPKLSFEKARRRQIAKTYNGKAISGKVVDITYSENKLMNGFIVKTAKETLKANVEAKFATQIHKMIGVGDEVSIKVYNADYWSQMNMPILISYKLIKDGKLLFDRWPKQPAQALAVNGYDEMPQSRDFNQQSVEKAREILVSGPGKEGNLELSKDFSTTKMRYQASDSVRVNKILGSMLLSGKAELDMEKYRAKGKVIHLDNANQMVTVYLGSVRDENNLKIEAEVIEIDLKNNRYTTKNYLK